jgi:probable HAF family extracellular repeat protein
MPSPRSLSLAVLLLSLFVPPGNAVTWTTIDYPGAKLTYAWGINSAGQIVGFYNDFNFHSHAFLDVNGTMTSFDYPGATSTGAYGVNDSGHIVGYYVDTSGTVHGFFFDGITYTTIEPPNATSSYLAKINNFGQMVGYYVDNANTGHTFVYDTNTQNYITLQGPRNAVLLPGGINNLGDIVGAAGKTLQTMGFLLSGGTYRFFTASNGHLTYAQAINDSEEIVGNVISDGNQLKGFIFSAGKSLILDYPGGSGYTQAYGINNTRAIVGYYVDLNGVGHGFLRTP